MANIAKLNVILVATSTAFTKGLKTAGTGLSAFSKRVKSSASLIGGPMIASGRMLLGVLTKVGIAGIAAGGALAYITKQAAESIDAQGKLAQRLGLTFGEMKSLELAAKLSGVSTEGLNKSIEKMSDTLGAASFGEGAAVRAFEQIGLSVDNLLSMSPAEQFKAIGAAIAALPDPAQQTAAARDIFGRSGGELVTLFNAGGGAIDSATKDIKAFGLNLSGLDVKKVYDMNDAFTRLGTLFEGIASQLAVNIAPYVTQITEDFISWTASLGGVPQIMDDIGTSSANTLDKMVLAINKILIASIKVEAIWQSTRAAVLSIASFGGIFSKYLAEGIQGELDDATARMKELAKMRKELETNPFGKDYVDKTKTNAEDRYANQPDSTQPDSIDPIQAARERGLAERRAIYDKQFGPGAAPMKPAKPLNGQPNYLSKIPDGRSKYMDKIPSGDKYMDKIPSGRPKYMDRIPGSRPKYMDKIPSDRAKYLDKIPSSEPNYLSKMNSQSADGNTEQLNILRQIAQNTGANNIAWAQ